MLWNTKIIIIGAGDKGTAAALRLFKGGFRPVLVEQNNPTDLHFFRNYSDVVYLGEKIIEDIRCQLINASNDTQTLMDRIIKSRKDRLIPLVIGELPAIINSYQPEIIIDSRGEAPTDSDWEWSEFPCVIRIGSAFKVGREGHFVIGAAHEELGRVYRKPADLVCKVSQSNFVSLAPLEGVFICNKSVSEKVAEREKVGSINDIPILAPRNGLVSGLLHSGHFVQSHQPLFEIVPVSTRINVSKQTSTHCLAIAGGILEAILTFISENRSN